MHLSSVNASFIGFDTHVLSAPDVNASLIEGGSI